MEKFKKTLVPPDLTVREVMQRMDETGLGIALVIDGQRQLLGVVTDGDIRRAILRGEDISRPISHFMSQKPVAARAYENDQEVLEKMRRGRLRQIPVVGPDGRVIALRLLTDYVFHETPPPPVVIMAGGEGTRLRPLTENLPKPLIEVGGKPVLELAVERLVSHGLWNIVITVCYKSGVIEEFFGDGGRHGATIRYIRETSRQGTAGSLREFRGQVEGPLLVLNGDIICNVNFRNLLTFHVQQEADVTLCVREMHVQHPYGLVHLDGSLVKQVEEKPTFHFLVNAGIYVLSPRALSLIPDEGYFEMTSLINKATAEAYCTAAFPLHEFWVDIGRPEDLKKAQEELATA